MSYNVIAIAPFDRQLKQLAKKYPSLKKEYSDLIDSLELNPRTGTPLGKNCYKIRLSIASKGKGKSGGARVITNFSLLPRKQSSSWRFMTNQKKKTLPIGNSNNCSNKFLFKNGPLR